MKTFVRVIAVLLALVLLAFLVPSMTPLAIGEEAAAYPTYMPVTLTAEDVVPLDYAAKAPAPLTDAFLPDNGGYLDDTLSVKVETMRAYDTTIMLVWVQIASLPSCARNFASPILPSPLPGRIPLPSV